MPPAPGIGKLPVPAGWTPEQWHRTWNRAHSRFYHKVRHQPPAERKAAVDAAHYSGEIRALALTINPPQAIQPAQLPRDQLIEIAKQALRLLQIQEDLQILESRPQAAQQIQQVLIDPAQQTESHHPGPDSASNLGEIDLDIEMPDVPSDSTTFTSTMAPIISPVDSVMKSGVYPLRSAQHKFAWETSKAQDAQYHETINLINEQCKEQHNSEVTECAEHSNQTRIALRTHLTTNTPGSWISFRPVVYVTEINALFDSGESLDSILERSNAELRRHERDQLCTSYFHENPSVKALKAQLAVMFDSGISITAIMKLYKDGMEDIEASFSPEDRKYNTLILNSKTDDEQLGHVRDYICRHRSDDSSAMKRLRDKWSTLWDQGTSLQDLSPIMEKDIAEGRAAEQKLRDELRELKLLAAGKEKEKKKKDDQRKAKEAAFIENNTTPCSRSGCEHMAVPQIGDDGESFRFSCLICQQNGDDRSFFCSQKCVIQHADDIHM